MSHPPPLYTAMPRQRSTPRGRWRRRREAGVRRPLLPVLGQVLKQPDRAGPEVGGVGIESGLTPRHTHRLIDVFGVKKRVTRAPDLDL